MTEFPDFTLSGRVALITGAARGLGRSIALAFANAGADIALGLRDAHSAADLVDEIEFLGRKVIRLQMDVLHLDQISSAIQDTAQQFGKLDILVNNAGNGVTALALDTTEQDFDFTLAINLKATFFACQQAAKIMIPQKFGRIINMSSQAAFAALPTESVYCASKAAVSHLTKCLAVEWGSHNIAVNAIAPTFIETPGTEAALGEPAFRADVLERIAAFHRIGKPVEVSAAAVFLASPAASLITGHTLVIDGGWTAR